MTKIKGGEAVGIAITTARLGLAEIMARHVKNEKPIVLDMATFIAADIMDGEILRKFDLDTTNRRIADGIVDHISMGRVVLEVIKKYPAARPYVGILTARAAAVGGMNALHLAETGEATKGQKYQKATNLATAAFAICATTGNEKLTHISGAIASGIALVTAPANLKGLGVKSEEGIRKL